MADMLAEKNIAADQRRRLVAVSAALDMVAVAVGTQGTSHRLSEEMQNLDKYVKIIETAIQAEKR
ncbi:MAG: hypothetical protein ACK4KV_05565 [Rhodocyclaceae bacterium]